MALVELNDNTQVESYILHHSIGNIIDLFTPEGEQIMSETKHELCITSVLPECACCRGW